MSNEELTSMRKRVNNELYWIKKKAYDLDASECKLLLNNKEIFKRKKVFCKNCHALTDVESIFWESEVCGYCINKESSADYSVLEYATLDEIEIDDSEMLMGMECNKLKRKIAELYYDFTRKLIKKGIPVPKGEDFSYHFQNFPFIKSFHWPIRFIDDEEEGTLIPVILKMIKAYLVETKRIPQNSCISDHVTINDGFITVHNIFYDDDKDSFVDILKNAVERILKEKRDTRSEIDQKIREYLDSYLGNTKHFDPEKIIRDFCQNYLADNS